MYRAPEYLIELCQEDFDIFVAVLEHPPEPNEKLMALLSIREYSGLPIQELLARDPNFFEDETPSESIPSSICPFCGCSPFVEEQLHGHYLCVQCRQITEGCCNGESGL